MECVERGWIDIFDSLFDEAFPGRRGGVVGLGNCGFLLPSQKKVKVSADKLTHFDVAELVRVHGYAQPQWHQALFARSGVIRHFQEGCGVKTKRRKTGG